MRYGSKATIEQRMFFGSVMQEAREGLNVSRRDFAKMLGIKTHRLADIELTGIGPDSGLFSKICDLLGLDETEYFEVEQ